MKKNLVILLLFCGVIFGACSANKNFNEPGTKSLEAFNTTRMYGSSFNATWTAALQALKDSPILVSKKENGYLMTDWIMGKSDQLYSGYGEVKIPYKIRYKFLVKFKPSKKGTEVEVESREQYYTDSISEGSDFGGSLYKWVDTKSSTHKENSLLDSIEGILKKSPKAE